MNQEFQSQQDPSVESTSETAKESVKKKKIYKKWWFWVIIAAVGVFAIALSGNKAPDLIDLPEDEYRAQCQSYSYDEIARSPEKYEKKLAKFTGKVVQVLRDGDELQMRVDVTETEYGFYEDTVFVFYTISNDVNVLEGDIITMYGELRGMQSYETVLGAEVSIPRIYVKFVDLIKTDK